MAKKSSSPKQKQELKVQADERNIVPVDASYEGVTIEDRFYLFWRQYGRVIIAAVVVVLASFLVWTFIGWWNQRQEARVQQEFQEAATVEQKLAFAMENENRRLAGVAFFEVANHRLTEGQYAEAAELYLKAVESLGQEAPGVARAKIGRGIALARAEQTQDALAYFLEIAESDIHYAAIRAEAFFHAALLAHQLGEFEHARALLPRVAEHDLQGSWSFRARLIEQRLPPPPEPLQPEVEAETQP